MKKWFVALLFSLFGVSNTSTESCEDESPIENLVGIHLLTDYGSGYQYLGNNIEISNALSELRKLPWTSEFIQFVIVIEPGISMEVGGSLNGIDGLAGVYRNSVTSSEAITIDAPESIDEMEEILISFLSDNDAWREKFEF